MTPVTVVNCDIYYNSSMTLFTLLTWILFIPIAFINGFFREKYIKKYTKEVTAHQISTIILSSAFVAFVYVINRSLISTSSNLQVVTMGISWVGLTILFEFGFGHYVNKTPWKKLLADYNIRKGRIWLLFLIVEFLSPFLVKMLL